MSIARIIGDANWRASMVIDGALLTEEAQARLCEAVRSAYSSAARGRVLGVDFSEAMLARAHAAVAEAGARNLDVCRAEAERLPVSDGSIDVALVNGIFNLNPARAEIFRELARVVRPGGAVFAAELILREPLPPTTRFSEAEWFA